jgi:hypothetical protein
MFALPIHDSLICFGDSLTQYGSQVGGFVASLQDLYQRRLEGALRKDINAALKGRRGIPQTDAPYSVISRGYGGYTSRQGASPSHTAQLHLSTQLSSFFLLHGRHRALSHSVRGR